MTLPPDNPSAVEANLSRGAPSLSENVVSAVRALRQNGMRTLLTICGMAIGVFAVVRMNPTPIGLGRYFEDTERDVCVLADKPRRDLFGDQDPIGQQVLISGRSWTVVGVLKKSASDSSLGAQILALSTLIYLPID